MSEMKNATSSEDRLEGILDQVRVLKAKYNERAEVTGENFNVFSILDRESDEVKTHSAIIAELLNPHGSHSQGTLFLKLFLEKLLEDKISKLKCGKDGLSDGYLKKFEVGVEVSFVRETKTERRRIDILIEKDHDCIVIENKIWADDQPEQLESYHEYAATKSGDPILIYLTPYGDEPGKCTLGGLLKDKVICLSYYEDIIEWVDACIKEVVRIPQIRETLHQYKMLLKKLTGQPINRRYAMALKNILLKDENYNLIPELENAISEVKDVFQHKFWKELKERLIKEQLADKNPKFQVYGSDMDVKEISDEEFSDEELGIHVGYNSLSSPGLTFSIPDGLLVLGNGKYEVAFRVEYETTQKYYFIVYGFVLCTEDKLLRVKIREHKEALTRKGYMRLENQHKDGKDNGWISWNYFRYEHKLASFITESEETLIKIIPAIKSALETRENNKA